jgi:hypothetical protein
MVELDFRERDRQARAKFAERLARLRETLPRREAAPRGPRRAPPARPVPQADEPRWWWQKD